SRQAREKGSASARNVPTKHGAPESGSAVPQGEGSAVKVLLLGDCPPPYGGVSVHVQQLHGYLKSHGISVKIADIGKGPGHGEDVFPVRSVTAFLATVA